MKRWHEIIRGVHGGYPLRYQLLDEAILESLVRMFDTTFWHWRIRAHPIDIEFVQSTANCVWPLPLTAACLLTRNRLALSQ